MQNDAYSDEIDLFELVATLWSEKWKIIFAALVAGGLGGSFAIQNATFSVSLPITIQAPLPVQQQLVKMQGAFPRFSIVELESRFRKIAGAVTGESSDPAGKVILLSAEAKKQAEDILSALVVELGLEIQKIESEIETKLRRAEIRVQTFRDTLDPAELNKTVDYAIAVSDLAALRAERADLQNMTLLSTVSASAWSDWVMLDQESPEVKPLKRPEIYTVLGLILGSGLGVLFVLISKAVRERRSSGV
jgi:uncharacterized protein involved in exopolysaccharide biosynthesis